MNESGEAATSVQEKYRLYRRTYMAKWRAANPEKTKELRRKQTLKFGVRDRAYCKAYRKAHPEANLRDQKNRTERKKQNGGKLSSGIRAKLFTLQKGRCACCRNPLGDDYHIDHIMPISLGGANTDDNVQLLRAICNKQKYVKHPIDFMQERGFLL